MKRPKTARTHSAYVAEMRTPSMNATSFSLLEQFKQAGPDSADWRWLHDIYLRLIRGWLRHFADLRDEADDLCQEVLAVLVRELPTSERRREGSSAMAAGGGGGGWDSHRPARERSLCG